MQIKTNDWLATIMNQPDMTVEDMIKSNILPDNTEFKPRDYYKNIPQVVDAFSENGKFNEKKFDSYYQSALKVYNEFADEEFVKTIVNNYEYAPEEWYAPLGSNTRDLRPRITMNVNPDRRSEGISGLGLKGTTGRMSIREMAQAEKVYDPVSNTYLDWSPNEKGGLFKSLARPALALSVYKEDGFHEVNGRKLRHLAGEQRLNELGRPVYEILGDQESYNRDVLHYTDTITVDGSNWNKYDFFDSDGLDKSIGGTLMKTVFTVAPMLIPKVGKIYGAISAGAALSGVLPTIMKSINGIVTGTNENELGQAFTAVENWSEKMFGRSVSDYSRNKLVSAENLGKLVEDVSLQLFQQRFIGEIPNLLTKGAFQNNPKLGQNLALAYMAATSSKEAYGQFKAAGSSDRVAGLGMLASMGAMYKLMTLDYFRNSLFKGTYLDENIVKKPAAGTARELIAKLGKEAVEGTEPKKLFGFISAGLTQRVLAAGENSVISSLGARALNEGIEETMEEFSSDMVKALFDGASALGIPMNKDNVDLNFNWNASDMLQRYAMSFGGGAIGGPIFEMQGRWEARLGGKDLYNEIYRKNRNESEELTYLIAQGRANEIRDTYTKWHKEGRFSNPNLSASKFEIVDNVDGTKDVISEASQGEDSQNDMVYKVLMNQVNYVESILEEEGLKVSQDVLAKMIEDGFSAAIKVNGALPVVINKMGISSSLFNDFQDISTKIVEKRGELQSAIDRNTTPASTDGERKIEAQVNEGNLEVQRIKNELNALRLRRDAILNGEMTGYYGGQGAFVLDTGTNKYFTDLSLDNFTKLRYGLTYNYANSEQKREIDADYKDYLNTEGKQNIFRAYDVYRSINERLAERLSLEEETLKDAKINQLYVGSMTGKTIIENLRKNINLNKELSELKNKTDKTESDEARIKELLTEREKLVAETNPLFARTKAIFNQGSSELVKNIYDEVNNRNVRQNELESKLADLRAEVYNKALSEGRIDADQLRDSVILSAEEQSELDQLREFDRNGDIDLTYALARQIEQELAMMASSGIVTINNDALDNLYDLLRIPDTSDETYISDRLLEYAYGEGLYDTGLELFEEFPNDVNKYLFSLARKFNGVFGTNMTEAKSIYQEMISYVRQNVNEQVSENQIVGLVNSIIPNIGKGTIDTTTGLEETETVLEYADRIDKIRANIKTSSYTDLLQEFISDVTGQPLDILEVIKSENKRMGRGKTVEEYTIDNLRTEYDLENALQMTKLLNAVINGAQSGLNATINSLEKRQDQQPFTELSENASQILYAEGENVRTKLEILTTFNKMNKLQRLNEHQNVGINMHPKFLKRLLKSDISKKFDETILNDVYKNPETKTTWTLEAIWDSVKDDSFDIDHLDKVTYPAFKQAMIRFETKLFDLVRNKITSTDGIVSTSSSLVQVFSEELWKMKSTVLSTVSDEIVQEYDVLMWLASMFTSSSNDFYASLKETANDADFKFAPVYSQEMAIRQAYAMSLNKEFFNEINKNIKNSVPDAIVGLKEKDIDYLKAKPIIENSFFVFGGAGTGKTSAIAYSLKRLLEKVGGKFYAVASEKNQASNLAKSLKIDSFSSKAEFFEIIRKNGAITDNDYETTDALHVTLKDVELGGDPMDNGDLKVLFVDESTLLNEGEWKLLSNYAKVNNVLIVALGDLKQNSSKAPIDEYDSSGKRNQASSGLEDTFMIKSPSLRAALRSENGAKMENTNVLANVLEQVQTNYSDNPAWDMSELDVEVGKLLSARLTLKYYDDRNEDYPLKGEKFVEELDADTYIERLLTREVDGKKLTIAIIVDDDKVNEYTEKYKVNDKAEAINDHVTIISSKAVQGGEFDFVVINKNWEAEHNGNRFLLLRDLYTLTQRSKHGSVIVDRGIKNRLELNNVSDPTVNYVSKLDDKQIEDYKATWTEGLKDIQRSPNFAENNTINKIGKNEIGKTEEIPSQANPTFENTEEVQKAKGKNKKSSIDKSKQIEITEKENLPVENQLDKPLEIDPELQQEDETRQEVNDDIVSTDKQNQADQGIAKTAEPQQVTKQVAPTQQRERWTNEQAKANYSAEGLSVIANDDFSDWISNDRNLFDFDKANPKSLFNFLKKNKTITPATYKQVINIVRNAVIFGYNLDDYKSLIVTPLNDTDIRRFTSYLQKEPVQVWLVPNDSLNRTVVMARFDINGEEVEIPVGFSDQTIYGRVNKLDVVLGPRFIPGQNGDRKPLEDLMANGKFIVAPRPVIFTQKREQREKDIENGVYNKGTTSWIKGTNGKTLVYITDDGLADFKNFIKPTYVTETITEPDGTERVRRSNKIDYLTQKDGKFAAAGIQKAANIITLANYASAMGEAVASKETKDKFALARFGKISDGIKTEAANRIREIIGRDFNVSDQVQILNDVSRAKFIPAVLNATNQVSSLQEKLLSSLATTIKVPTFNNKGYKEFLIVDVNDKAYAVEYREGSNQMAYYKISPYINGQIAYNEDWETEKRSNSYPIRALLEFIFDKEGVDKNLIFDPKTVGIKIGTIQKTGDVLKVQERSANNIVWDMTKVFTYDELVKLDAVLQNDVYFKNGIFANDKAGEIVKENDRFSYLGGEVKGYSVEIGEIYGSIIVADVIETGSPETIVEIHEAFYEFTKNLDQLERFFIEKQIYFDLSPYDLEYNKNTDYAKEFETILENVNNYLADTTLNPKIPYISKTETGFTILRNVDYTKFAENLLARNEIVGKISEINHDEIWNFGSLLLSLPDGNPKGFSIIKVNGEYELAEFASINGYINLINFIMSDAFLKSGLSEDEIGKVRKYIKTIQENNGTKQISQDYLDIVEKYDLQQLQTLLQDYLLERLQNNEC